LPAALFFQSFAFDALAKDIDRFRAPINGPSQTIIGILQ